MEAIRVVLIGVMAGGAGAILLAVGSVLLVRWQNRLPRQTESDRIFDAEMAQELAKFEAMHADYEGVQGLRQILGGGIWHKLEGLFSPAWAKPSLMDKPVRPVPLGMSVFDTPEQQRVARLVREHNPSAEAGVEA